MKKYEFTEETLTHRREDGSEVILHRIRALRDVVNGSVHAGDLGGFLEREENLAHDGECWVAEEARVLDDAHVQESASVRGQAVVSERAVIRGKTWVIDHAEVGGDVVLTNGLIEGHSFLTGHIAVSAGVTLKDVVMGELFDPEEDDYLTISGNSVSIIEPAVELDGFWDD